MKKIGLWVMVSAVLIFLTTQLKAEIVSYIDENGEMRFVNTDFANVPEKYLDQVNLEIETPVANEEIIAPQPEPPPTKTGPEVEILISLGCMDCDKLQTLLNAHKILYTPYDINSDQHGKELYEQIGGDLPITKIGDKIIYGIDMTGIVSSIRAHTPQKKKETKDKANKTPDPKPKQKEEGDEH